MRAVFVTLFILCGFILGFYVLWMNLTPGHFQKTCPCGTVLYVTDNQLKGLEKNICPQETGTCFKSSTTRTMNDIMLFLAQLDSYR